MSVTLRERQVRLRGGAGQPGRRPENLRRIGYGRQRPRGRVMSGGIGQLVMNGPLILAVPVAAAAGAITFISPCCLPLIPGYLSYVTGMSGAGAEGPGALASSSPADDGDPASEPHRVTALAATISTTRTAAPAGTTAGARAALGRGRTLAGTALFVL